MDQSPKHQRVVTYQKIEEEAIKITTKSYYEELAHMLEEIEKPMVSSFFTLKKDIELALDHVLKDGSPKLVLTIEIKNGQPKIIKRYVTIKESYPKR